MSNQVLTALAVNLSRHFIFTRMLLLAMPLFTTNAAIKQPDKEDLPRPDDCLVLKRISAAYLDEAKEYLHMDNFFELNNSLIREHISELQ